MSGEIDELIIAINTKASDATLLAVTSDVYFSHVPGTKTMPWIVYDIIATTPVREFNTSGDWQEALVQFSMFDDSADSATINQMFSDLNVVFDRQTLTYDTKSHISCAREGSTGPMWFQEDDGVWQMTADYRIRWQ